MTKDAKLVEDGNLQLGSEEWLIRRHLLINGYYIFCDTTTGLLVEFKIFFTRDATLAHLMPLSQRSTHLCHLILNLCVKIALFYEIHLNYRLDL